MTTILIIEDDMAIHSLMKEALELNGYTTLSAFSGTEGKLLVEHKEIDLILLDLMLPGLNGEGFLKELRTHTDLPVIVISAKSDQTLKVDLLMNGADDYLTKPFDVKELLARIDIQLRHAKTTNRKTAEVQYKNIHVNLDTREVKVNGNPLHLTGREFEILTLFLENPEKVFSRANIYESVWNEPFFDSDKTVNMHISNLRNKLNSSNVSFIKTVWGIGFKFD